MSSHHPSSAVPPSAPEPPANQPPQKPPSQRLLAFPPSAPHPSHAAAARPNVPQAVPPPPTALAAPPTSVPRAEPRKPRSFDLLRTSEVARLLGLSTRRVQMLLRNGLLPGVRFGKNWMIPRRAFEAYLRMVATRARDNLDARNRAASQGAASAAREARDRSHGHAPAGQRADPPPAPSAGAHGRRVSVRYATGSAPASGASEASSPNADSARGSRRSRPSSRRSFPAPSIGEA